MADDAFKIKKGKKEITRDVNMDLLRIIACLYVILIHVGKSRSDVRGGILYQRVFTSAIIGDANALFWALTGCFWFSGSDRDFLRVLKNYIKKILFPAVIFIVLFQTVYGYFEHTFLSVSLHDFRIPDLSGIFCGLFKLDILYWGDGVKHYWYIFEYFRMVLWYPLMAVICDGKHERLVKYILYLSVIPMLCNTLGNLFFGSDLIGINIIPTAMAEIVLGYMIYHNKKGISSNSKRLLKLGVFIVILLLVVRSILQLWTYKAELDMNLLAWNTCFSYVNVTGYLLIFLAADVNLGDIIGNIIIHIAGLTYFVFLIHGIIIKKLSVMGVFDEIYAINSQRPLGEIIYVLESGMVVFIISLILAYSMQFIYKNAEKRVAAILTRLSGR